MVAIPAIYWGGIDTLREDKWWKTPIHTEELQKPTLGEIEKALLIGKVIHSGKKNCWEVALICAKNELSMIHGKDIWNFLYMPDDDIANEQQSRSRSTSNNQSASNLLNSNQRGGGRKRNRINSEHLTHRTGSMSSKRKMCKQ